MSEFGLKMILLCALLVAGVQSYRSDMSGFFLKAPKSVPRAGRSIGYDGFFLKASKSVPRVGRRDGLMVYPSENNDQSWYNFDKSPVKQTDSYGWQPNENAPSFTGDYLINPHSDDGNLSHRSRRYNLPPYEDRKADGEDVSGDNTKEIDEAHYQSDK